ncbi:LysR family transcriptional regulator [Bradyrhizobium sp. ARR65]|uniref:LysR family transcriptional regulator n=1 Tax=Bradyrhizobium sp. ARR65 TaxID=1040989 RepID=UPI000465824D|nr:LysR family transcriptional regulator [Bradyrhizobium sp. ARR65]
MAVTFRQLEAFIAVAETHNFTRAAERLRMAQPMVSSLIRELEAELGFRLFDRTTRRVQLTAAAVEFLNDARRLTSDMDGALRRARDVGARRRGHIKVGAPPLLAAALLPKAIREFAQSSPGVAVSVVDRSLAAVHELLTSGDIDLAVGTFRRNEDGIARIPLVPYLIALLCRADHRLAAIARPRWRDLAGVPLIALRRGNGIREQIEQGYAAAGLNAEPAFELDQLTTILAMVEAGFGITVLPLYALSALPTKSLVARELIDPMVTREIDVAHREDRSLSPAALDFVRLLRLNATELQSPR